MSVDLFRIVHLDVLRYDNAVIDIVVDELVLRVGAHVSDLDGVVNFVIELAIFAFYRRDLVRRNAAEIGLNVNQPRRTF